MIAINSGEMYVGIEVSTFCKKILKCISRQQRCSVHTVCCSFRFSTLLYT
jgi:hypothetical protein